MTRLRGAVPVAATAWLVTLAVVGGGAEQVRAGAGQGTPPAPADPMQAFLQQYCLGCHNGRAMIGGLALDPLDIGHVAPDAATWEKVVRKIRTGMMPPSGARRPERAALDEFAASLETRLDDARDPAASLSTPALHRLNRTEYANAVRDLLALDVDVSTLLPADGSSQGFDNLAEGLAMSPALVEGYVSAAMKISRLAVGDREVAPSQITYSPPPGLAQDRHIDGLPLGTRGGMLVEHTFPLDAEYEFSLGGRRGGPGGVDITLDGRPVEVEDTRSFRLRVPAGPHTIGLAVPDRRRGAGVDEIYSDFRNDASFTVGGGVNGLTIIGPYDATGSGDTPSRQRIFSCRPADAGEEEPCAESILSTLARRAYRGPVSAAELETLMDFYRQGRQEAGFEAGIQRALARVLVAPRFVFRAEEEPPSVPAGTAYDLSDVDLASRLSFFLWSSIPDDELLDAAIDGRLGDPDVLAAQVRRMLDDPRADALVENFAGQWLYLRELEHVQTEAPKFDDNLRRSFRRETELLFDSIVREDRSLLTLLDAGYTYVDERLARHYGIPDVYGSHFRRVELGPDDPRRGLLGHGSVLTVTSVASRTSPVSRGKWVLENLLGTPAPVPPPGVETDLAAAEGAAPTSLRQRLELHRASPVCASCHKIMDPMGFALENFDRIGEWREYDGPTPIDASGQLADGTPLDGPASLRDAVLDRSDAVMTTAAEKLMTYALGRPVEYYDMPTVRAIVQRAASNEHRFSSLVLGIIESDAFRKRVTGPAEVQAGD